MDKSILFPIILEWQKIVAQTEGIFRSYQSELFELIGSKPIKIVTGFRRSGKSFLVQKTISQLIAEKKIAKKNVLYLNFEDYQLASINNAQLLDEVFQLFMNEIAEEGKKLIVLDEIQLVNDWDKFVRTIYEKYRNIEIILTGSNSELLSSELGSNLAGRFVEIKILPFDFKEFTLIRGLNIKSEKDYFENINKINSLFGEYLNFGGLPELVSITTEKAKQSYLEGVLSKVVLDDVVNRFNVRQPAVIDQIIKYLFIGTGNITSYARISTHLKTAGHDVKSDTVANYVDFIVKTFAMYALEKLEYKQSRVFGTIKKFYSVDTGFSALYGGYIKIYSRLLENVVFLKLKRESDQINFGQNESGKEIDFVVTERDRSVTNYQVAVTLNESNKDRELSSFVSIDRYISNGRHLFLSTDTDEKTIEYSGIEIERRNIVRWLLGVS
ncbi:MAG TPA: ATP-binding protein [bacterium]|jgi:predicted AAA+ superfamily ATPase|nr:ATP-binding protein [bacterium]MDX9805700.1 ATP-binding protein [bacterium]HNZ54234.1 ATP-binding protein [bacterium]HOG43709.1 ATP-binding protein [bacterium]HPM46989.1 ATP-binding protein [bacterium]